MLGVNEVKKTVVYTLANLTEPGFRARVSTSQHTYLGSIQYLRSLHNIFTSVAFTIMGTNAMIQGTHPVSTSITDCLSTRWLDWESYKNQHTALR